jgi:hypothetical protein
MFSMFVEKLSLENPAKTLNEQRKLNISFFVWLNTWAWLNEKTSFHRKKN